MRTPTIVLLVLVSAGALVSTAQAKPGDGFGGLHGPGFPGPEMMLEHMADHLDLDDAQRETVQNILEAAKPEIEALREQAHANREALQALDVNDAGYSTELDNLAISNGRLATEGTLLFTRVRTEIDAVLTDEQRAKLERGKKRMRKAMEHRRSGR